MLLLVVWIWLIIARSLLLFPTDGIKIPTFFEVKVKRNGTTVHSCHHLQTLMYNHMHQYWYLSRFGLPMECVRAIVFVFFYFWIKSSDRRRARNETPQSFHHGCPWWRPDHRNTFLLDQCKGQASLFMDAGRSLGSGGSPTCGHKWAQTACFRDHEKKI